MSFKTFLTESLLLEGGNAIKGSDPLTQSEALAAASKAIALLSSELSLPQDRFAMVGSAGKKPDGQLSRDIDIAVELSDIEAVKRAVERLGSGKHKHMPALGAYSFGLQLGSKTVQCDVMPVKSLALARWAYHNDVRDLQAGLKGAHRNEVLFTMARLVSRETLSLANGEEVEWERWLFDLNTGLSRAKQAKTRLKSDGRLSRSHTTIGKRLVTSDPDEVAKALFGQSFTAAKLLTFDDVMDALESVSFDHKGKVHDILQGTAQGLLLKGLAVPERLAKRLGQL